MSFVSVLCPPPRLSRIACLLTLGATVGTVACDADAPGPTEPDASVETQQQSVTTGPTEQQDALEDLGRAVALALDDRGLRQRIVADMQASPIREGKLELRSYLSGSNGGILKAKMRQALDVDGGEVDVLTGAAPRLEFYLPLKRDRLNWDGEAVPLVATQINDEDDIVAFTTTGERLVLDPVSPPDDVVLSLVPVETDFDAAGQEMQLQGGTGATVAPVSTTMNAVCDPEVSDCNDGSDPGGGGGGGGGGGFLSFWEQVSNGVWIDGAYIGDLREPWTKGEPEIEILTLFDPVLSGEGVQIGCAAESVFGERQYKHNEHETEDRARLATEAEANAAGDPPGLVFVFYEDDDTTCEIVDDNTNFEDVMQAAGVASGGLVAARAASGPFGQILAAASAGFTILASLPNFINTNDDIIGTAVELPCEFWIDPIVNPPILVATGNYQIHGKNGLEGCATLLLNTEGN